MDLISSFTNNVIQKSLDGHAKRHLAISSNLANVDTPGYRHQGVSFEGQLEEAIHARNTQPSGQASNAEELAMKGKGSKHFKTSGSSSGQNQNLALADLDFQIVQDDNLQFRKDENGVDVETEMVRLAKNTERYIALNNIQGRMMRSTRGVISNSGGI